MQRLAFLSPLPSQLLAAWGAGTSVSGERFDGISMCFSVPVAQQHTSNPAWATGVTFWITVGDSGPRGLAQLLPCADLSPPAGGGLLPSAPWLCLFNLGRARGCQLWEIRFFSGVSCCTVVLWECPLSSGAGSQIGPTHRPVIVHRFPPQGQGGGRTIQSMAASGQGGAGRAVTTSTGVSVRAEAESRRHRLQDELGG